MSERAKSILLICVVVAWFVLVIIQATYQKNPMILGVAVAAFVAAMLTPKVRR